MVSRLDLAGVLPAPPTEVVLLPDLLPHALSANVMLRRMNAFFMGMCLVYNCEEGDFVLGLMAYDMKILLV